jgi:hypothetical protein
MKRSGPIRQRLTAIALAALSLLTFPMLGLPQGEWFGFPSGLVYLFGVWGGAIALAAWVAERQGR